MIRLLPHVGLRTFKTGLAVALALLFADLRGSPSLIFAAIGAISAMSRTVDDAFATCRTQFFGITLGAGVGCVFVSLLHNFRYFAIGLGLIGLILLCVRLKLQFAVPLAGIVFVSICLAPAEQAVVYSLNRLADTAIGLATALVINIAIKPYNNRAAITRLFTHFLQQVPACLEARVLHGRYPDLAPLSAQMQRISDEITVFEKQNVFRTPDHDSTAVYLRGCEQLASSIVQELSALCAMDERGRLSPENAAGLNHLGLTVPSDLPAPSTREADVVGNYHLRNLLDAYRYLEEFICME